jgi:translation initiation factor IF-3
MPKHSLFIKLWRRPISRFQRETPKDGPRINQEILAKEVRLVDPEGEMLGVMTKQDAILKAQQSGLDLVEISPHAEPPVCKIMDFGKFKYEQQKKKNEAKKKQKIIEVKEVQLRPMIDTHDLDVKCKAIERFLSEGNKVKITMRFRGREFAHQEFGLNLLKKVRDQFEDMSKVEFAPKLEGRAMIMILAPDVKKI